MTTATAEQTHTGVMSEMNDRGDTKIMWDKDNEDEVEIAEDAFERLVTNGRHAAFAVKARGAKGEQIRKFDPDAEKIILVPQLQGG